MQNPPRVAWWQAQGRSCVVDVDLKWVWLTLAAMFTLGMLIHVLNIG